MTAQEITSIVSGTPPKPDETIAWNQRPLSKDEAADALRVAESDDRVMKALGGDVQNIQATEVYLWVGENNSRAGAVVVFTVVKPVDFKGVMPTFDRCAAGADVQAKGYGVKSMRFTVRGLSKFQVDVDLRIGRVVAFRIEDATGAPKIEPAD